MSNAPPSRGDSLTIRMSSIRSTGVQAAIARAKARGPIPPPPNREEILGRLRERAQRLSASRGFAQKKT
jgi:hypothetical protein